MTKTKTELVAALDAAIAKSAAAETCPGIWEVEEGQDYVMLAWRCDQGDAPDDMYGDEPWSEWGGNEIIESSGASKFDDSGGDSYTDRSGDQIVSQWVQWNFTD